MLAPCTCKHTDQDKLNGKGIRVHTVSAKEGTRCTVCGPIARDQQRLKLHAANHINRTINKTLIISDLSWIRTKLCVGRGYTTSCMTRKCSV